MGKDKRLAVSIGKNRTSSYIRHDMASAEAAAHFHKRFQQGVRAFHEALDAPNPDVSGASSELKALKEELSRALPTLPPYDQRNYDLKIRELESRLLTVRPKETKPRFAFGKSRQAARNGETAQESDTKQQQQQQQQQQHDGPQTTDTSQAAVSSTLDTYALSSRRGTSLSLSDLPSSTTGHNSSLTVLLKDLHDCTVDLRPTADSSMRVTAIHAEDLKGTVVVAPIMEGACMLSRLEGCLVVLGAQQFRIHDSNDTTILLDVPSVPIMEHSAGLTFGPYPFELAGTQSPTNRFAEVQDFDWVREGSSPNWKLLDPTSQTVLLDLLQKMSSSSINMDIRSQLMAVLQNETVE